MARGLFTSRARARAAIEAGLVAADGACLARPSDTIRPDAEIVAEEPYPWVSRGGVKLAAALDAFRIDPTGLDCLDVGASTGGFTQVLLARGAARVTAVDVGRGQLHPLIAADPRVEALEATDARDLAAHVPPAGVALVTVDVSFISLRLVLPAIAPLLAPTGRLIALVKPQFEVGRAGLGKGGIVRDDAVREAAIASVIDQLPAFGLRLVAHVASPIVGGDGNAETLIEARRA